MTLISKVTTNKKRISIILSVLILLSVMIPVLSIAAFATGGVNSEQDLNNMIKNGEKNIVISSSIALYRSIDIPNDTTITISNGGHLTVAGGHFNVYGKLINNAHFTIAGGTVLNTNKIINTAVFTIAGGDFINNGLLETLTMNGLFVYHNLRSTEKGKVLVSDGGVIYYGKTFYDSNGNKINGNVTKGTYIWDISVNGFKLGSVETNNSNTNINIPNNNKSVKLLSAYNGTDVKVESNKEAKVVLPKINNSISQYADIEKFKFEISTDNGENYKLINNYDFWSNRNQNNQVISAIVIKDVNKNSKVRISLKSNPKDNVVYNLNVSNKTSVPVVNKQENSTKKLTRYNRDGVLKEIEVESNGNSGIAFPNINNKKSSFWDYGKFHFEISKDNGKTFRPLSNEYKFVQGSYQGGKQYGYWRNGVNTPQEVSGIWIREVKESMKVKISLVSNPNEYLIYNLNVKDGDKSSTKVNTGTINVATPKTLSAYADGTDLKIEPNGNCGTVFPKINGKLCTKIDNTKFNYEISEDNGNTYKNISTKYVYQNGDYTHGKQYGFWTNGGSTGENVAGIWIRKVEENFKLKISLKTNPQDFIVYNFKMNNNSGNNNNGNNKVTPPSSSGSFKKLIWSDEFNGNNLNMSKWSHNTGFFANPHDPVTWGWGNSENEWYSSDYRNVNVNNGVLNLVLYNEPKNSITQSGVTHNTEGKALFSSGKVVTKGKFSFKYGRIDVRAKCSAGTGLWPAIWLLPESNKYGGWPKSGEIDIFEGRGRLSNQSTGAIHFGNAWPNNTWVGGSTGINSFTGYHVYSVEWKSDSITWYVDGKEYMKHYQNEWFTPSSSNPSAPFDQNFYIILNLAAGGHFDNFVSVDQNTVATKNGNTITPPRNGGKTPSMQVDYVRVYQ